MKANYKRRRTNKGYPCKIALIKRSLEIEERIRIVDNFRYQSSHNMDKPIIMEPEINSQDKFERVQSIIMRVVIYTIIACLIAMMIA